MYSCYVSNFPSFRSFVTKCTNSMNMNYEWLFDILVTVYGEINMGICQLPCGI